MDPKPSIIAGFKCMYIYTEHQYTNNIIILHKSLSHMNTVTIVTCPSNPFFNVLKEKTAFCQMLKGRTYSLKESTSAYSTMYV